jgi:hypothetical protein
MQHYHTIGIIDGKGLWPLSALASDEPGIPLCFICQTGIFPDLGI